MLKDPVAFKAAIDLLESYIRASHKNIDYIAGESQRERGGSLSCVALGRDTIVKDGGPFSPLERARRLTFCP